MLNFALVEELSPDISKAVHLSDCLEGFGKHWQGQITGGLGHSRTVQEKARQTTQIDDFISHDWSTNGTARRCEREVSASVGYRLCEPKAILAAASAGKCRCRATELVSVAGAVLEIVFEDLRFLPGLFVVIGRERMEVPSAGCFGLLCGMCCLASQRTALRISTCHCLARAACKRFVCADVVLLAACAACGFTAAHGCQLHPGNASQVCLLGEGWKAKSLREVLKLCWCA
ncbi:unnamed protein product [Symbiodinium sp. KB8]|nr:unnamed protein product [Symbiodinium sp. KB8]